MSEEQYSYEIKTGNLVPPIGGVYRYYAKVLYLYKKSGQGEVSVKHDLGEAHGKTEAEAREKMMSYIRDWINRQGA